MHGRDFDDSRRRARRPRRPLRRRRCRGAAHRRHGAGRLSDEDGRCRCSLAALARRRCAACARRRPRRSKASTSRRWSRALLERARGSGRGGARARPPKTLAELKDPASASAAVARVGDPDPFVRAAALRALRALRGAEALRAGAAPRSMIARREVRREAVGVLGYLQGRRGSAGADRGARTTPTPKCAALAMSARSVSRAPGGPGCRRWLRAVCDDAPGRCARRRRHRSAR